MMWVWGGRRSFKKKRGGPPVRRSEGRARAGGDGGGRFDKGLKRAFGEFVGEIGVVPCPLLYFWVINDNG
jgi:hypothetical protein